MVLSIALLAMAGMAHEAQAWDGPYFAGYGYFGTPYGGVLPVKASSLPHFALYPSVYYSFPVARTYGTGPFAYLPGVASPGVIGPGTMWIREDYQPAPPVAAPSPKPLVVVNPFVK